MTHEKADRAAPGGAPPTPAESSSAAPESDRTAASQALDLVAPAAVTTIAPAEAEREVALPAEAAERIDEIVRAFVDAMSSLDIHGEEYGRRVADLRALGEREIVATSQMSNRLLERPVRAVDGVLGDRAPLAKRLVALRHTVEDLDPAKYDLGSRAPRKLLGIVPVGDRLRDYFDRYTKAQRHIDGIVDALREGRGELERDNAALVQEQRSLWSQMEMLRQYAYMAQRVDDDLEARIDAIAATDEARARALREDVLFEVRRRRQQLLTQLAVAAQGYAALRIVEKNNSELGRAVQVATTTTVAAMRTAVMVAQALTSQRLVSDQLKAVNEATGGMIEGTSSLLRDQSAEVATQATSPGVDMAVLQRAWDNVFAALDQIDTYKLDALEAMKVTVRELTGQVERSRQYLGRLEPGAAQLAERQAAGPSDSSLRLD